MDINDELERQINDRRKKIKTSSYSSSIGELINIYVESEINLHPKFQRFFRWDAEQKTALIESILLDIPMPPIFVFEDKNNKWEVIDGLQRLSTIFEFFGSLKDEHGKKKEQLVLQDTKYLPALISENL